MSWFHVIKCSLFSFCMEVVYNATSISFWCLYLCTSRSVHVKIKLEDLRTCLCVCVCVCVCFMFGRLICHTLSLNVSSINRFWGYPSDKHVITSEWAIVHELKRHWLDILGLAEVKWTGVGETATDEAHKIWYCREELKYQYEVTFLWKEVVGSGNSCTPHLEQIHFLPDLHHMTMTTKRLNRSEQLNNRIS